MPFAADRLPAFFHIEPRAGSKNVGQDKSPIRVDSIRYLNEKYIVQWARDEDIKIQPLDMAREIIEEEAELAIALTDEDRDGVQRTFKFGPSKVYGNWSCSTPFSSAYLS